MIKMMTKNKNKKIKNDPNNLLKITITLKKN
jgi:hypothetical protein